MKRVSIGALGTDETCPAEPVSVEGMDRYTALFRAVPLIGVIGLGFALICYVSLFRYPPGDATMGAIAERIRSGTAVFLKQEYKVTGVVLIAFFILLCWVLCVPTGIAFLVGSLCGMLPGWIGMKAATTSNVRTCQAAKEEGASGALNVAFRGGAVMGISVASVGVIGLGTYCLVFLTGDRPEILPNVIAGFCLGASFFALFGRVGGGIFTKSADIGADMTGKVEFHLPEDDPRNPAVIADNVGDNVGDVAGMGLDLFESYTSAVVATIIMALGMSADDAAAYVALPLVLMGLGLASCILVISLSRVISRVGDAQAFLRNIVYVANMVFVAGAFVAVMALTGQFGLFLAVLAGVVFYGAAVP